MDSIYVLGTMSFPDELLNSLRALSPRLTVVQHNAASVDEVPSELWPQVEVLYTLSALPDPARAPKLRWVQLHSAGVNQVQDTPLWESDVIITTLSGVHASNMAEYVLMMMLAFAHRLPRMLDYQARAEWPSQRWRKFVPQELRGATLGVIGYGSIGREVGRLAHAFGMRVLGLHHGGVARVPGYELPELAGQPGTEPDRLYTPDQLAQILAECDYVLLAVPHTSATHHLMNQTALRAMKPTAVLVNVARGAVVDEAALVHALREGWIAGAALDVFEQEPLPADSPLWKMDNVVISPHVAGFTPHYDKRATALFGENLRRYLDGEPLLNRVERGREY
ncbi:MAG: D-2-hydroxyacid dehydrogenase [Anaerolineae bacterium]|jgi:phosphoglycerate dehydrogenase-like enzyme